MQSNYQGQVAFVSSRCVQCVFCLVSTAAVKPTSKTYWAQKLCQISGLYSSVCTCLFRGGRIFAWNQKVYRVTVEKHYLHYLRFLHKLKPLTENLICNSMHWTLCNVCHFKDCIFVLQRIWYWKLLLWVDVWLQLRHTPIFQSQHQELPYQSSAGMRCWKMECSLFKHRPTVGVKYNLPHQNSHILWLFNYCLHICGALVILSHGHNPVWRDSLIQGGS